MHSVCAGQNRICASEWSWAVEVGTAAAAAAEVWAIDAIYRSDVWRERHGNRTAAAAAAVAEAWKCWRSAPPLQALRWFLTFELGAHYICWLTVSDSNTPRVPVRLHVRADWWDNWFWCFGALWSASSTIYNTHAFSMAYKQSRELLYFHKALIACILT